VLPPDRWCLCTHSRGAPGGGGDAGGAAWSSPCCGKRLLWLLCLRGGLTFDNNLKVSGLIWV
jgi:hypothetical protein